MSVDNVGLKICYCSYFTSEDRLIQLALTLSTITFWNSMSSYARLGNTKVSIGYQNS